MTKDELENELEGTKSMLKATEQRLANSEENNSTYEKQIISLEEELGRVKAQLPDFNFLLQHGLQMDYEMRTLTYRAPISLFVVQDHRQTVYVEGRGTIASETLYQSVEEALQSFYGTNSSLPG